MSMLVIVGLLAGTGVLGVGIILLYIRQKHVHLWLGPYFVQRIAGRQARREADRHPLTHVLFCLVDHFEPIVWAGSTVEVRRDCLHDWLAHYPALAHRHRDSNRRPAQHTWFYPGEAYHSECLNNLTQLCRQGLGEIELHLHHGHDTEETLTRQINHAIELFGQHGALCPQWGQARPVYAFIHGNMALDNSRDDPRYCGVNGELTVLKDTGCYADFSLPTAPCESQSSMVNKIFYATDDPHKAKSFDSGEEVVASGESSGDLMIVPGPLTFNWASRKWGLLPRIENGEIQGSNPPTRHRVRQWVETHIHVKGRPEWVFVKVSCHGAEERSRDALLGEAADTMYDELESRYCKGRYRLHYVTAREMYNVIKAAEAGQTGDPSQYYDYIISPYRTHNSSFRGQVASS